MGFENPPMQPPVVDDRKNDEEWAEDQRAHEARKQDSAARHHNEGFTGERTMLDKILGRNKMTGVDMAHGEALEEDKKREGQL